ncbi:MAG: hypothetical protein LBH98_08635 [Chitinispirillales bacterium]|jgi:hypothetical protein|nr:hypothetical protein [Chitinispirillales bacterium]
MKQTNFLFFLIWMAYSVFAFDFSLKTNVDADVTFKNETGGYSQTENTVGGQEKNVSINWINSQMNVKISVISKNGRYNDTAFTAKLKEYPVNFPAWDKNKSYPIQYTKVSHNGKNWRNEWYANAGAEPGKDDVWKEIDEELPILVNINLSAKPLPTDTAFIPVYSENDVVIDIRGENNYNKRVELKAKERDTLILPLGAVENGNAIKNNSANKKISSARLISQQGRHFLSLSPNDYKNGEIRVVGINGRVISADKLTGINQTSVTVSNVAAGVYLLNVKGAGGGRGTDFTGKIMHNGGDLRIAASFNGQFEVGGLVNSRTMISVETRGSGVDFTLSVIATNLGAKNISISAFGGMNSAVYISFLSENFSQLMDENKYNEFFPNRYGLGYGNYINNPLPSDPSQILKLQSDGDYDFFTYNSLLKAIDSLGQIEFDLEWACDNNGMPMGGYQKIEWTNKKTGVKRTFKMPADYDDWETKIKVGKIDYAAFCGEGSLSVRKQELAAFLGNISHETTGGGSEEKTKTWGLYWREEVAWQNGGNSLGYIDGGNKSYPPAPGKSYHGRGPIQISWNYNYGQLSEFLYGDKQILLDNPDAICPKKPEDATLAFMSAVWFWMTPQVPKPSCHQVYAGTWNPSGEDIAKGRDKSKFGMAIFIINGGLECNGITSSDYRVVDRIDFYKRYIKALGETPEGKCDCDNMK